MTNFARHRAGREGPDRRRSRRRGDKQRIARPNEGKSGGFRSIVLFKAGARAFFAYGFPKNVRDNLGKDELNGFKELADEMLSYGEAALEKAMVAGALIEVKCDE